MIILQAGKESHEGMARAVHALLYTRELKEHGHEVALVFDGAGTEWAEEFTKPDSTNKLTPMYRELSKLGVTEIICDFCAGAFKVKESLAGRKRELTGDDCAHMLECAAAARRHLAAQGIPTGPAAAPPSPEAQP